MTVDRALPALAAALLLALPAPLALAAEADDSTAAAAKTAEAKENRDAWVPADEVGSWYAKDCAVCHGKALKGSSLGPSLLEKELLHGDSVTELMTSIAAGFPAKNMPAWAATLSVEEIRGLAIYIAEQRVNAARGTPTGIDTPLVVPSGTLQSEHHAFRLRTLRGGIVHPYSIAALPDGRILLTEKARGLSVVSVDGATATLVKGTPKVWADGIVRGNQFTGRGWVHDVALHPDYAKNGWVYLSHGDRCDACNAESRESGKPVSMIRLVRGRIVDGAWTDQQIVWQADKSAYQHGEEVGTGSRIAFDDEGHVFLSLGVLVDYKGIQDLGLPYGKIHRVHDDGRIPEDNPFAKQPGALKSIWTLGHRNPQGLDFDRKRRVMWSSEHGPRGGDEANIIAPGRNYGWPLVSRGIDYDGRPIHYAKDYGIEFDPADLTDPVIDWTPSPGVSSIVFYRGAAFPEWQDDLLVATLNGFALLRIEVDEHGAKHSEEVISELGRIRDVEVDAQGRVLVLVEHPDGSQILRLEPAP